MSVAIMTSNPQFNDRTSGLEVAKTFRDQIKGKNGKELPTHGRFKGLSNDTAHLQC